MKHKMPADRYRGYTPPGTESLAYSLDEERPPDLKEAYSMGPVDAAYDEYHLRPGRRALFRPQHLAGQACRHGRACGRPTTGRCRGSPPM